MELVAWIVALVALGGLALRYGADSRRLARGLSAEEALAEAGVTWDLMAAPARPRPGVGLAAALQRLQQRGVGRLRAVLRVAQQRRVGRAALAVREAGEAQPAAR